MSAKDDQAVERCAASLASILGDGKHRPSPARKLEARGDAVSSLRNLSDEALLETLHRLYRAGVSQAQEEAGGQLHKKAKTAAAPPTRTGVGLWLTTAALAGAIVMGMEIVAFRLYAPYLGYSIYVWGTMISVVMAALAAGYAFGGWLADRSRTDAPLYWLVLASAMYQLVVALTVHSLLPALSVLGDFVGTALATLIVFAPPMAGLATVGPFVIRLLTRAGRAGSTAGRVYALSTMGSIAGILLTSFVLIPHLGTQATLATACGASAMLGVGGLIRHKRATILSLLPVALLPFGPQAAWGDGTVWVSESAYNLVRVVREGTQVLLILNDERSVATRRESSTGWTGGYYDDFSLGPILVPARSLLVLGMGAGGSITSTRAVAPDIEIDAVEIDPMVVEAAFRYFGFRRDDEQLRIHVDDARPWCAQDLGRYDIVHVDLYQGGPYIPFYLVTREFFELVRARMADDGMLMVNIVDAGAKAELVSSAMATLKKIFPTVASFSRRSGNHMVLAFSQRRSIESIRSSLLQRQGDDHISRHARQVASAVTEFVPHLDTPVLTDDQAPVESMTRRMLAAVRRPNGFD